MESHESTTTDHSGHEAHEHGHGEHGQLLIVLFVFVGLMVGGLLREVNKKTKFPYTPMVVIVGLLMGHFDDQLGIVGVSTQIVAKINPHLLLYIFIPTLIFESSYNCNWFVFKRAIVNILLLAVPGVLLGALLIGAVLKLVLNYEELSWPEVLMMGSIMSATDPVAVVALLKELGASITFNTLIEGESLLNDGVAMVFYQLFLGMIIGQSSSPGQVLVNFIRVAFGGPLLGFIFGIIGSYWLRKITRDEILTVTVTFITCYIVFFFAEFTFLKVSGILSIVSLGLFMSAFGKINIYPESEHAVHTCWCFVQYACETLIFLLTGIIIGIEMLTQSSISTEDWVKMFIFWIFMMAIRLVMLFLFKPILEKTGYGITMNEIWVLCYGGLRGALGLTLALMVYVDPRLKEMVRLRQLTIFYMAGMALLTLLVNGTTCASLVRYLKMIETPKIKNKMLKKSLQKILEQSEEALEHLQTDRFLQLADWEKVEKIVGTEAIEETVSKLDMNIKNIRTSVERKSTYEGLQNEIDSETRFKILRTIKTLNWEMFEDGNTSSKATMLLDEAIDKGLDNTYLQMDTWSFIYSSFTEFSWIKYFFQLHDWAIIGSLLKGVIMHYLAFIYEVSTTFITCASEAKLLVKDIPIEQKLIEPVINRLSKEILEAELYINTLQQTFPGIIKAIQTKRASNTLLKIQKKCLTEQKHAGYIGELDFFVIRKEMDRKALKLENMSFEWTKPFRFFVVQFPVFHSLSQNELADLQQNTKTITYPESKQVQTIGNEVEDIYIINKGSVQESLDLENKITFQKSLGAILSYNNLIGHNNISLTTIITNEETIFTAIPYAKIKDLMNQNHTFKEDIYQRSMVYNVVLYPKQAGYLQYLEENKLNSYCLDSKMLELNTNDSITLEHGGYVIYGEIQNKMGETEYINDKVQHIKKYSYVEPSKREFTVKIPTILLQFTHVPEKITEIMKEQVEGGNNNYIELVSN